MQNVNFNYNLSVKEENIDKEKKGISMNKKFLVKVFAVLLCVNLFTSFSVSADSDETWPVRYSDAGKDINKLPEAKDNYMPKKRVGDAKVYTGWTGGVGNTKLPTDGIVAPKESEIPLSNKELIVDDGVRVLSASMPEGLQLSDEVENLQLLSKNEEELKNNVRDWVAKEGFTLREILKKWAEVEGWEVAWNTKREYPLKASVIFRGRFKDVSAALIRTFSRATPQPIARFFFGNKVLVVKTLEVHDAS